MDHQPLQKITALIARLAKGRSTTDAEQETLKEQFKAVSDSFFWQSEELKARNEEIQSYAGILLEQKEQLEKSLMELRLNDQALRQSQEQLSESEQRFRLISENVADFVVLFTVEGRLLYASPSVRRIGYDSDALLGKPIFDMIHQQDIASVQQETAEVQRTLTHRSTDFRFRHSDGSWIEMEATISLLINNAGAGLLVVMRDVSERKRNERHRDELVLQLQQRNGDVERALQRLTQMQTILVQSEKMASLGQLTAGIAHEINNPLSYISSNLNRFNEYFHEVRSLLAEWMEFGQNTLGTETAGQKLAELESKTLEAELPFVDQDFDELMKHSTGGAGRIKRIVDQLRGFAHISKEELVPAQINQILEQTLTLVWNELKYKTTVIREFGDLPLVECNEGELQQVFVNLLVNAAHAIPEKGEIRIRTVGSTEEVRIEIADTGDGIREDHLTKIFDPFFTTKPVGKGTGLGLWIVSTIIQNHQGTIKVESEVGKGTLFTITIPVHRTERHEEPETHDAPYAEGAH